MPSDDFPISPSFFTCKPDDPAAVVLEPGRFPVHADGAGDDAPALQQALDQVAETTRWGLVLVPEGRYRLGGSVHVWRGIRIVGYGARRPVFYLAPETPFYRSQHARYLLHFCEYRPERGRWLTDAMNTTFFSGLSNVDFEIGPGNPAAVAVRFFVAQHSSIEHVDFRLGDAQAGIHKPGNEIEDCRFFGGRYGIQAARTSAGWQQLVLDCVFSAQQEAAIETMEAGLTAIRCEFSRTPYGILVPGPRHERLFVKDCLFREVPRAAIRLEGGMHPANQANVERSACANVPVFFEADGAAPVKGPSECYQVTELSHGLHLTVTEGAPKSEMKTESRLTPLEHLPPRAAPDFPRLPPQEEWVSVRRLGARGDGVTDDTAVFQRAIAEHRVVYVPTGHYLLSETLRLRPDTVLLGLHPFATQLQLRSRSAGFDDPAAPRALLETPPDGRNILSGVGVNPGLNRGAVAVLWQAGAESYLDDVFFAWAGDHSLPRGENVCHSLWISGGGGTFKNFWSANYHSRTGLRITETRTPGRIYLASIEHHAACEVELDGVENWAFYAVQTEENVGSGGATALVLRRCRDLSFANLFCYRVMALAVRHPHALRVEQSGGLRFRGLHVFSLGPHAFDSALHLPGRGVTVSERECARLDVAEGP